MRLGTIIKFKDGRIATVIYNGLDGVGIQMGKQIITDDDIAFFRNSSGGLFSDKHIDEVFRLRWSPEFLLRPETDSRFTDTPCIGMDYKIIKEGIKL